MFYRKVKYSLHSGVGFRVNSYTVLSDTIFTNFEKFFSFLKIEGFYDDISRLKDREKQTNVSILINDFNAK